MLGPLQGVLLITAVYILPLIVASGLGQQLGLPNHRHCRVHGWHFNLCKILMELRLNGII
jgi:hypothetical protein